MKNKKVLIIEDDPEISELLNIHLTDLGCSTDASLDGGDGYSKAKSSNYDLVILDIRLPTMDGIEICQRLRANEVNTPIIMLTARTEEIDRVLGLEVGADDYMTKPFSVREFIARVKAIFRRSSIIKTKLRKRTLSSYHLKTLRLILRNEKFCSTKRR